MAKLSDYALTAEAVRILGVSVNTVRNWARDGNIPHHRNPANGYKMFRRTDLEMFLEEAAKVIAVQSDRPAGTKGQVE